MSIQNNIETVTQLATGFIDHQDSVKHYNELSEVIGKFNEAGLSDLRKNEAMQTLLKKNLSRVSSFERDKLSNLAKDLLEAFGEEATAQSLKKDGRLINTLRALKKLVTMHQIALENAFGEFIRSNYGGIDPRDLGLSAAKTPQNSKFIRNFKAEYERFIQVQQIKPVTDEVLDNIETIGASLQEIIKKVDFDIPDEVKNFFNGIENGGAKLSCSANCCQLLK